MPLAARNWNECYCLLHSQRPGEDTACRTPRRSTEVHQEAERTRENVGKSASVRFHPTGAGEAGEAGWGVACVNHFSVLRGTGPPLDVWSFVPGDEGRCITYPLKQLHQKDD